MADLCDFTLAELGHVGLGLEELDRTLSDRKDPAGAFYDPDDRLFRKSVIGDLKNVLESMRAIRAGHDGRHRTCGCWEALKSEFPDAGWDLAAGMRNETVHRWYDTEEDTCWAVVSCHLDGLREAVRRYAG